MNGCELIALVSSIACGIAKCCTTEEVTILAVMFTQLGDSLSTYLAQTELINSKTAAASVINEASTGNTANTVNTGNTENTGNTNTDK